MHAKRWDKNIFILCRSQKERLSLAAGSHGFVSLEINLLKTHVLLPQEIISKLLGAGQNLKGAAF